MSRQISENRKTAYNLGLVLIVAGLLSFLSVFVTGAINFGNFSNFEAQAQSSMLRAIGGMVLMMIGGGIRAVGARGAAGSGLVLDPEQAREDLEPYSRMAGGMVKDALDSADIRLGGGPAKVVMIRCPGCRKLNEEDSKFCQECGGRL